METKLKEEELFMAKTFNKYSIQLSTLGKENEKSYFMNGLKDETRKSNQD